MPVGRRHTGATRLYRVQSRTRPWGEGKIRSALHMLSEQLHKRAGGGPHKGDQQRHNDRG